MFLCSLWLYSQRLAWELKDSHILREGAHTETPHHICGKYWDKNHGGLCIANGYCTNRMQFLYITPNSRRQWQVCKTLMDWEAISGHSVCHLCLLILWQDVLGPFAWLCLALFPWIINLSLWGNVFFLVYISLLSTAYKFGGLVLEFFFRILSPHLSWYTPDDPFPVSPLSIPTMPASGSLLSSRLLFSSHVPFLVSCLISTPTHIKLKSRIHT